MSRAHDDARIGAEPDTLDRRVLDEYFALLADAGHELNSADNDLLATVRTAGDEEA
ncbi:hypothetical protein G5V59_00370 [Nocardioides sp. W3-2-3]|uniref:hypothetical protein n=1 Tax=Nocardioides convexus TaxID=2712224 RepID=UPI0024187226|nr:hypothetical protein [Nocardioides convexus]NGZ99425.1 hypothetical protein [Nocardioides convexus]